jgi:TatA/E family protein of Tat protein translocase
MVLNAFLLFLNSLGGGELMLILLVVLLFFGANKIPELARGLGKGIREFKDAADGIQREIQKTADPIKEDLDIRKTLDQIEEDDLTNAKPLNSSNPTAEVKNN